MPWTDIPPVSVGEPIGDMDDWLNTYISGNLTFLFGAFSGALVYQSAAQSISNNTWTSLQYAAEAFDTAGYHDTATNNTRLTVPTGGDGLARILANVGFESLTDENTRGCRVLKNGTDVLAETRWGRACSADQHGIAVETIDSAAAGDYYEIQAFHLRGSAANTVADRRYFFAIMVLEN